MAAVHPEPRYMPVPTSAEALNPDASRMFELFLEMLFAVYTSTPDGCPEAIN